MMGSVRPGQRRDTNTAKAAGFTIIETMIVLAITGVLFVAIVGTISGRQSKVQFNQAINQAKGDLEDMINQAQSGRYPNNKALVCNSVAGIVHITQSIQATPNVQQGTRLGCVFIGKVLQFGGGFNNSNPSGSEKIKIYNMAGNQDAVDLASSGARTSSLLSEERPLLNGLTVQSVKYGPTSTPAIGAVGIITYFAAGGNGQATGSQTVQTVPISGSQLGSTSATLINTNTASSASLSNPAGGVRICFKSGTTQQSGLITLGGKSGTNTVTLDIKESPDCT